MKPDSLPKRSLAKDLCYQAISNVASFGLAYAMFGNISDCATFGVVCFVAKTVIFYYHERLWNHIPAKRGHHEAATVRLRGRRAAIAMPLRQRQEGQEMPPRQDQTPRQHSGSAPRGRRGDCDPQPSPRHTCKSS